MKGKSLVKVAGCGALALALSLGAAGCGGKSVKPEYNNPEARPLVMSLSQPDGVFNPFFSTSAYDGNIVSMTQISMLATDKDGGILPRKDSDGTVHHAEAEPCVVKYWDSDFDPSATTGDQEEAGEGVTTYQFALKNGIKFSDGEPLTMKDVLFNLYTYLDPAYTGSSTIYSTHILGLNAYRTQNANASDSSASELEQGAMTAARERMQDLVNYVKAVGTYAGTDKDEYKENWPAEKIEQFEEDFNTVAAQFYKELESDWNTAVDSIESYKDWKGFNEAWLIFLMNDGEATDLIAKREGTNIYDKDKDGNCHLDTAEAAKYRAEMEEWCTSNGLDPTKIESQRKYCIQYVYDGYFPEDLITEERVPKACHSDQLEKILIYPYWPMTNDYVSSQFAAEWKLEKFGSSRTIGNISGVTTFKASEIYGHDLGEECEILQIKIRGIDPKAIWNFAFTVAPLHYYSGKYTPKNGTEKDYVAAFDPAKNEFGIEFGDFHFFQNVLNASSKVGLPVGAGPYMASDSSGNPTKDGGRFFDKNWVYYQRNPYFETVGEELENAKIKYLRYKVVASDQIIAELDGGDVDIGDPNATTDNITRLNKLKIAHTEVQTAGYGYVGINPRFVPNIYVRRAIMKAMDTNIIFNNYYKGGLAEKIVRPMSKVSWAYPDTADVYVSDDTYGADTQYAGQKISYAYDSTGNEIEALLRTAGYTGSRETGWSKTIPGFGTDTLDYKFTIAGGSTDHPAYSMFLKAQEILNRVGFKIKVVQSQTALSDLTTGKLAVWAAAWSSTIDPDMYQVYHKDSKASSVNNWGYPQILNNQTTYPEENDIIQRLSGLIDEGRETDDQETRKGIYRDALDLVMELAVEFPSYQRSDMTAYRLYIVDPSTLTPKNEVGAYNGLTSRIWEVNYYLKPAADAE